jgi:hypothetical protein
MPTSWPSSFSGLSRPIIDFFLCIWHFFARPKPGLRFPMTCIVVVLYSMIWVYRWLFILLIMVELFINVTTSVQCVLCVISVCYGTGWFHVILYRKFLLFFYLFILILLFIFSIEFILGCISFVCPGYAEHVLANEVVRNTLREQTEQCAGCTTFWGGAEGIKMAEPTIFFFYIEFLYTLLIFLELRNTKEMRGFFRGEEGLCKLWIQSTIVL